VRFVSYRHDGDCRAGVEIDGRVIDEGRAAETGELRGTVNWTSMRSILECGPEALAALVRAATSTHEPAVEPAHLRLAPPVPDPRKIICLGLNYLDHAEESGLEAPTVPILFAKFATSLIATDEPIILPDFSREIDSEAELAVVIGKRCRNLTPEDVPEILAGATAFNDISARDVQLQTSQWLAGKAIDSFGPCGPSLVTLDELGDVQNLAIRARVNGATVQDGNTNAMIFTVRELVAYISKLMTLEPGDIIATGTPAGVGISRTPPLLLHDGDSVEVEIERIGVLRNPVVGSKSLRTEPDDAAQMSSRVTSDQAT
jgi:2-keto-4-pentenoate hydratase/2-oxohepta-3-ene-1,7-dioic acid hydratase in catechol pathway